MERIKIKRNSDIEIKRNVIERFLMTVKDYFKSYRKKIIYIFSGVVVVCVLVLAALIYVDIVTTSAYAQFEEIMDNYRGNIGNTEISKKTIENLKKLYDSTYFGFVHKMTNYVIGNIYFNEKNYKQAREYLEKFAAENKPSVFTALALQKSAVAAEENNDINSSIEIYKKMEEKYSSSIIADQIYYNLGRLYARMNDIDSSRRYLNMVITSFPQSSLVKNAELRLMLLGINKK